MTVKAVDTPWGAPKGAGGSDNSQELLGSHLFLGYPDTPTRSVPAALPDGALVPGEVASPDIAEARSSVESGGGDNMLIGNELRVARGNILTCNNLRLAWVGFRFSLSSVYIRGPR